MSAPIAVEALVTLASKPLDQSFCEWLCLWGCGRRRAFPAFPRRLGKRGKRSRSAKPIVHISTGLARRFGAACGSRGSDAAHVLSARTVSGPDVPITSRALGDPKTTKNRIRDDDRGNCRGLTKLTVAGNRWFESTSLQRRVRLSREVARRGREPRLFAWVCRPWEVARSAETGIGRRHGADRRQCLCWAKFQYRSAGDVVQGGRRSCRARVVLAQTVKRSRAPSIARAR